MALKARVSFVKRLAAGDAAVVRAAPHASPPTPTVATVPIGYADGVRRGLSGVGPTC